MDYRRRTFLAFWLFGVVNNVLYVVILSAAVDLLKDYPGVPKAAILMADILPAFLAKIVAPFYLHSIPYPARVSILIALSSTGMIVIAWYKRLNLIFIGVAFASLSSGLGEVTFLQLTHFYEDLSLKAFSSGTGGAGILGSFTYLTLTTFFGVPVPTALLLFSILPFSFAWSYFYLLPEKIPGYELIHAGSPASEPLDDQEISNHSFSYDYWRFLALDLKVHLLYTFTRMKPLAAPYMLPLTTVYFSEYVINQGVSPSLLFPLNEMPFEKFRDVYVVYSTLYQLGVFISRSSSSLVRIPHLKCLSVLQFTNLIICITQSMFYYIPNVYMMMLIIFYEGLLGGASYVNTFLSVLEETSLDQREFAMGVVGISDSAGIVLSAWFSIWLEPQLCQYQIQHGRPWCQP
ncbi:BA75_03365T0 [Komagataella pastoris]|uniref:Protein BTN n=1 Tax=Komagataella pastoris TaxID=4922 RepID=A0A1B2JG35_PICPA|nr:BA75_03365T0 [Komagataella pastoris]